ncbi:hypothetical protein I872_01450 [Streptococcus cristatus AS 1.3089]|uniref:Uncharacterized protein n=1 Tax=Streptococcus cristatus AS 1.3089 TaxID=1302863 RepID=A0ABN4B6Z2_STRCR|nr:hypothetical protein I872_01450 [Streptococcus cristatus AS 1.3089]
MKKFVAELIGTFMLVFIGTGAVVLEMVQRVLDTLELLLPLVWQSWLQLSQSELFQVRT